MKQQILDTPGLKRPMPALKTKQVLSKLQTGQTLCLISTDSGSIDDIAAFCKQTGNQLISNTTNNDKYTFIIEKNSNIAHILGLHLK